MIQKLILWIAIMTNLHAKTNDLIHEDSPYLLQHAHNPVAWHPWGEKAFELAKKENKLIFLSIGYSTCHWCHVMERESFEDKKVAKILNKNYISIKVDREEHPNIDRYYQDIYMVMNKRGGGWPLTIIMTPDKKPFFSGTYIPKERLIEILKFMKDVYTNKRDDVYKSADSILLALKSYKESGSKAKIKDPGLKLLNKFVDTLSSSYDSRYKGIGTAPKFPHATTLDTLLDIYRITKNKKAKMMALKMLQAMSEGGIYDQIEGGFFRYSTDERWMIPHFEKMLYTNGELLEAYANGYFVSKDARFKEVALETINNIRSRFEKEGVFFSASDADSDGEEGKYFLFNYDDTLKDFIKEGFSKEEAIEALYYYGIIEMEGNFATNLTNPYITRDNPPKNLEKIKKILYKNRQKRSYPFIDHKIQTSWNALYLKGELKCAKYIDPNIAKKTLVSLDALIEHLYKKGELYHQVILGKKLKIKGYLEDYAFLISTLLDAYEVEYENRYLKLAKELEKKAVMKFYKNGVWQMSDDSFSLEAQMYDSSYRSALVVILEDMLRIAILSDNLKMFQFAKESFEHSLYAINKAPNQYPYAIKLYSEFYLSPIVVKNKKEPLLQAKEKLNRINYPYIESRVSDEKEFLACKIDRCFGVSQSIDAIIKKIEQSTTF